MDTWGTLSIRVCYLATRPAWFRPRGWSDYSSHFTSGYLRTLSTSASRRPFGGWLVIPVLFAVLAYTQLTRYGLWHDEIYTLSFMHGVDAYLFTGSDLQESSRHPLAWYQQLLQQDQYWPHFWRDIVHEGHPPLYFLLLKGWTLLWGTGERGLRSFSLLAATLTLLVAGQTGQLVSRRAAWLLPLLLACCPPFLYFALEARMYALYLLLAALNLYWLLRLLQQPASAPATGLGWFVATGVALVYTHYYGVFWYGCLALVLAVRLARQRAWGPLLLLALPGLALLGWLPVLHQQTAAHKDHWTNGYLGLVASGRQYLRGGADLLLAQTPTNSELAAVGGLALLALLNLGVPTRQQTRRWAVPAGLLLLYGAGVILLDGLLNHHTIAVPRYYLPLQFALLLGLVALGERGKSRLVQATVTAGFMLLFAKVQVQQLTKMREAKQMYREAGRYLAQRYPPTSVEVVVSPNGPTTLGIAYYCPANFVVRTEPVGQVCSEYAKRGVVIVEQNLGLPIEPKAQPCAAPPAASRLAHFVFVDVVNAR